MASLMCCTSRQDGPVGKTLVRRNVRVVNIDVHDINDVLSPLGTAPGEMSSSSFVS